MVLRQGCRTTWGLRVSPLMILGQSGPVQVMPECKQMEERIPYGTYHHKNLLKEDRHPGCPCVHLTSDELTEGKIPLYCFPCRKNTILKGEKKGVTSDKTFHPQK